MASIAKLAIDLQSKASQVKAIWDEAGENALSADKLEQVKGLNKEIETLENTIAEHKDFADVLKNHDRIVAALSQPESGAAHPVSGKEGKEGDYKTIGQQFIAASEFKQWLKDIAPNGYFPENQRIGNGPVIGVKTVVTGGSDTSAGALVNPDIKPLVALAQLKPLTLIDLITISSTNSDTIDYPVITGYTNNAAMVAEATSSTAGGVGVSPESAMALDKKTETVKTLSHWIPITKRALSDAGQIQTYIDTFLMDGLKQVLENQMINGDGTGENFTGLTAATGLTTQAFATDILTTARKARTKVRVNGRATPNAYLMHPDDWEAFDMLKDSEARYYFGGPSVLGTPRLWGIPVVENEFLTAGRAFLGDFKQLVLWNREQASLRVSDSHSDFFIKRLVAILADMRAAFGILRPLAICDIDLTA